MNRGDRYVNGVVGAIAVLLAVYFGFALLMVRLIAVSDPIFSDPYLLSVHTLGFFASTLLAITVFYRMARRNKR